MGLRLAFGRLGYWGYIMMDSERDGKDGTDAVWNFCMMDDG